MRPQFALHPATTPVPLRPAATLLLLRDVANPDQPHAPTQLQVLMTRRSAKASFAPGAYVFPGGVCDAEDSDCFDITQRQPTQDDTLLRFAITAVRESYEELGIALLCHADGRAVDAQDVQVLRRDAPFLPQVRQHGWCLATQDVQYLAHWVTDRELSRRFDVAFVLARMPQGQEAVADEAEQFEPVWLSPTEALRRHAAGDLPMIFPTVRTLEHLQRYATVEAALADNASGKPQWNSCPRSGLLAGKHMHYMEHEAPYGELAMAAPNGEFKPVLDWQSQTAVPLRQNVQRLTAPNASVMTGPGTNSYIVGSAESGYIVIDPGPAIASHVQRLWDVCTQNGGQIAAMVCTHSHPDHSPAAALLQSLCEAHTGKRPPIYGMASGAHARADSRFAPDVALADGACVSVGEHLSPDQRHTLQAVHTPGHTHNHLCLLLQEDHLLFCGDHILNGSTTVIDPPDGDMDDYLHSLDKLHQLCRDRNMGFLLPAHGHVLHQPLDVIEHLKAHRLKREAKVAKAMQALPSGSLQDWVKLAYDDVPERLWPVALRSLSAHVLRLQKLSAAQ